MPIVRASASSSASSASASERHAARRAGRARRHLDHGPVRPRIDGARARQPFECRCEARGAGIDLGRGARALAPTASSTRARSACAAVMSRSSAVQPARRTPRNPARNAGPARRDKPDDAAGRERGIADPRGSLTRPVVEMAGRSSATSATTRARDRARAARARSNARTMSSAGGASVAFLEAPDGIAYTRRASWPESIPQYGKSVRLRCGDRRRRSRRIRGRCRTRASRPRRGDHRARRRSRAFTSASRSCRGSTACSKRSARPTQSPRLAS